MTKPRKPYLMADICRCDGVGCGIRETCARYLGRNDEFPWLVCGSMHPTDGDPCGYFIDVTKRQDVKPA